MDRIGRYDVIEELGRGGMGQVFVARDPELDRKVAIKLLYPARAAVVSLRDEARALAALSHPNIVTIYEVGRHEEQPFIAMEYLPGRPLHELLRGPDRPSRDALVAIAGKVASALAAAHAAGILHRDIKPENVIVAGDRVTVVDFGIAQRLGDVGAAPPSSRERAAEVANALTQTLPISDARTTTAATPTIFGTPAYMAPEVLGGVPSSAASDVYSLGVLLYECLAGRRPYDAPNLVEVIALVIDGAPIAPLADPLGELVARMLAADPADRPSLAEIGARLAPRPGRSRALTAAFAAAGAAVLAAGLVAWLAPAKRSTETVRVGIGLVRATTPSYGAMPLQSAATGDVLARLLSDVPGIIAVGPLQLGDEGSDLAAAARRVGARYFVSGAIEEHAGRIDARLELVDLADGTSSPIVATAAGVADIALLVRGLGDAIAEHLHAGRIAPVPDRARARELVELGAEHLRRSRWYWARPYFEQAVERDPTLFEAWSGLASAEGWTIAPEPMLEHTLERTVALAPPGPRRELWRGASQVLEADYPGAIVTLGAPANVQDLPRTDQRDLAYWYGEALWHDGRFGDGMKQFLRVLDVEPGFGPAAVHASGYALGRRDRATAERLVAASGRSPDAVEFMLGHYAALAEHASDPSYQVYAALMLGREPTLKLEMQQRLAHQVARAAAANDLAGVRRLLGDAWPRLSALPIGESARAELEDLLRVLLAAQLAPEAAQAFALYRRDATGRFRHGVHRFGFLLAPLVQPAPPVPRDGMTTRNQRLAAASDAELAGDRARAVELLRAVIEDPGDFWDYEVRAALIRNLVALGRTREVRAACAEAVLRPAIACNEMLPLRATCRGYLTGR